MQVDVEKKLEIIDKNKAVHPNELCSRIARARTPRTVNLLPAQGSRSSVITRGGVREKASCVFERSSVPFFSFDFVVKVVYW